MSEEQKNFTQALDELEDKTFVRRITRYRQNLVGFLKPEYVRQEIARLANESQFLDFFNERSRKFQEGCVFKLRVLWQEEMFKEGFFPNKEVEKIILERIQISDEVDDRMRYNDKRMELMVSYVRSIVNAHIIHPFTALLDEKGSLLIEENENLRLERDSIFNSYPELKDHIKAFIVTTLFKVYVSIKENNVTIEFIM